MFLSPYCQAGFLDDTDYPGTIPVPADFIKTAFPLFSRSSWLRVVDAHRLPREGLDAAPPSAVLLLPFFFFEMAGPRPGLMSFCPEAGPEACASPFGPPSFSDAPTFALLPLSVS